MDPMDGLVSDSHRHIIDTVRKLRNCGLDSILSLPQIVVCGDQSSGKSSVLEALTGIPFPRNDNLCTRFATEIVLHRETARGLSVKVIPDDDRSTGEQERIRAFSKSVSRLEELPSVMQAAASVMGIAADDASDGKTGALAGAAFAKDTLSLEMTGPECPELTLIDIPGLIQSSTKGVSDADVAVSQAITDRYISQHRTICLAVISATHDAANQQILQRVRKVDPRGERTLGVITKPDQLPRGSGTESKFIQLARNDDVPLHLGWHVVKNRSFEEKDCSFQERDVSETLFFKESNFGALPAEHQGIDTLRTRLSHLLLTHVIKELPRLRDDLDRVLKADREKLQQLGSARLTPSDCRMFLARLSSEYHEICQGALNGFYQHEYFKANPIADETFSLECKNTIARLRAAIQYANSRFAKTMATAGHRSTFMASAALKGESDKESRNEATKWMKEMLTKARGTELLGTFNPNLIGELFWIQSEPWEKLASAHIELVGGLCERFLVDLLGHKTPKDVEPRIRVSIIQASLQERKQAAYLELSNLIADKGDMPINYNHYYTENIINQRKQRVAEQVRQVMPELPAHKATKQCERGKHYDFLDTRAYQPSTLASKVTMAVVTSGAEGSTAADMDQFSSEEALDCLLAIYKVQLKTFIANVTTQVIERHLVRKLGDIFSPLVIVGMDDAKIKAIAAEQPAVGRQRTFLECRIKKLEEGSRAFEGILGLESVSG